MKILAIETSCDETSAAVVEYARGQFKVLSNIVSSQIKIHRKTGGVVPEVAAREHVKQILPVINTALWDAQIKFTELDRLAVVTGPGLITSLMVGVETAKVLADVWRKPLFVVNHVVAHLAANLLNNKRIKYPALGLVVSGGHTELVLIKKAGSYKLVGATRDDAAGECFDKCAKILGLKYPGGPEISKFAAKGQAKIDFPRPMLNSSDLDFSFSGLKTAVLYFRQKNRKTKIVDICASLQSAIVEVLVSKTIRAVKKYKVKTVMLAGGVAANQALRKNSVFTSIPDLKYCTDQAAMVGAAAAMLKKATPYNKVKVDPNWEL